MEGKHSFVLNSGVFLYGFMMFLPISKYGKYNKYRPKKFKIAARIGVWRGVWRHFISMLASGVAPGVAWVLGGVWRGVA